METYDPYRIKQALLAASLDRFQLYCMEAGIDVSPILLRSFAPSLMWVAIETAAVHYANNPDQLTIVGRSFCLICDREVEDWTVIEGGEPSVVGDDCFDPGYVLVAGPCLHRQPWPTERAFDEG